MTFFLSPHLPLLLSLSYLIPPIARTQEQAFLPYRPSEDQSYCQYGANCQVSLPSPLTARCGHVPEFLGKRMWAEVSYTTSSPRLWAFPLQTLPSSFFFPLTRLATPRVASEASCRRSQSYGQLGSLQGCVGVKPCQSQTSTLYCSRESDTFLLGLSWNILGSMCFTVVQSSLINTIFKGRLSVLAHMVALSYQ